MNSLDGGYSAASFGLIYRQAVADVMSFWTPEMQAETARHNSAWAVGQLDFTEYLYASQKRYEVCCEAILRREGVRSICDIGGFFGAFPLALKRMGYEVAMTEALKYYSVSFDRLFAYLTEQGIAIIDYDPFDAEASHPSEKYDALTAMAVLEHYPHSPKTFMNNVRAMAHADSVFYAEVPNIAYMPKRLNLLRGRTPLATIRYIYSSAIPFTGHHHEYTMTELVEMIELSGMCIVGKDYFNYSFHGSLFMRLISDPLLTLASLFPNMREEIAVTATISATQI